MPEHLKTKIILGFAVIYIVWGSTYLGIRFAIESIPPFMMVGIRFVIGGFALFLWSYFRNSERPKKEHWIPVCILSLLMPMCGTGLVTYAELTVPSGLTALMVGMAPMWITLSDWLRPGGVKPNRLVVFGLILGFTGMMLLVNPFEGVSTTKIDLFGTILIMISTLAWAVGSIYSRHAVQPKSKLLGTSMQLITGGFGLILTSMILGEFKDFHIAQISTISWVSLIYLTSIGTFAYAVYVWLISASTPDKVATYAYVNPIIALGLGSLLAGESLTLWHIFCSIIILSGVIIIITTKSKKDTIETILTPHSNIKEDFHPAN